MKYHQKYLSSCLLATVALLVGASPATAQVSLGAASGFSVLGGVAVTCTDSVVTGDVGSTGAFTNTRCTIAGGMPPATNTAAANAQAALRTAYDQLANMACDHTILDAAFTNNSPVLPALGPGVYCFPAAVAFTDTTLTLDGQGNPKAVWIFKVGAALAGSGFQVVMTNGAQPCNVFWAVGADVKLTTSTLPPLFQGNILAAAPTPAGGSITMTGGTLAGRALANVAVTMTGASVVGCGALSVPAVCKGKDHDGDDDDKDHRKCNQGVGNGREDCDPGHSDDHKGSNDEHHGDRPGNPGRKGGDK